MWNTVGSYTVSLRLNPRSASVGFLLFYSAPQHRLTFTRKQITTDVALPYVSEIDPCAIIVDLIGCTGPKLADSKNACRRSDWNALHEEYLEASKNEGQLVTFMKVSASFIPSVMCGSHGYQFV